MARSRSTIHFTNELEVAVSPETMKSPFWIDLAEKAPDAFWCANEKLLVDLAKVAIERKGSRTKETAAR
jgi:hypothetical protein